MQAATVVTLISNPGLSALVFRALANLPVRVLSKTPEAMVQEGWSGEGGPLQSNCDVAFLEVAAVGERLLEVIRAIKTHSPPPAVVTVHARAETEGLLAAFRAGADDCLYLPVDEPAVRQVFQRVAEKRIRERPRRSVAKTVGFLSPAGGCGGTTVACHFAQEVWRVSSQSTLLADFDLLAGMVGFWMRSSNEYSVWDVMRAWERLDTNMWRGLVSTFQPQLDVLSAPSEVVSDEFCDPEQLFNVLEFGRAHYDWVVADLGSSLSPISLRLLSQLNALFVVSTADLPVLFQTKRVLRKLLALGYPRRRVRLLLNGVRRRQFQADEVSKALGWEVEAELPFDGAEIEEAQADGRLISRKSELGKRIAQLAAKFTSERLEDVESPRPRSASPVNALTRVLHQDWRLSN
jgi:pilus assembly protein CpaE